ncbi:MAG TPA: threonine synthase [Firmicutes bacterium]|jgi:threonine synthase|nr:threonine synthase [Bacillota bacterium]
MREIIYKSTRGESKEILSAEAIVAGIAGDGGLYVPHALPRQEVTRELAALTYQELAARILRLYFTDFQAEEISAAVAKAYDRKFDHQDIAPLKTYNGIHFLELFHGPTLAFKDMALAILPHFLKAALKKTGKEREAVILTATSGDTGKAALEGFAGVEGTKIIVFFPEHGVSRVQKRQMVTQWGDNTYVIGIEGNFDDAQRGVKAMFTDEALRRALEAKGYVFSSANSINIGRLIPQIVYYYWAYLLLLVRGEIACGENINIAVPTGNFGNILAAYYALQMGLPVNRLLCASNSNKVLFDFFATGIYDSNREFYVTMSPSMDILISSNLERLLYHTCGEDTRQVKEWMATLQSRGHYRVTREVRENMRVFAGGYAGEEETSATIRNLFAETGYLIDPHTAVAYAVLQKYRRETKDGTPAVVAATASPYKFPGDVLGSIDPGYREKDEFALFAKMGELLGEEIPKAVQSLQTRPVRHKTVCRKDDMRRVVENILQI